MAHGSKKNEDAILERLLQSSEKQRRAENTRDEKLTAPLLNELIEKIVVHQSRKDENSKKVWDIEIYYRFVGKID